MSILIICIAVIFAMTLMGYAMNWVPFARTILRIAIVGYAVGIVIVVLSGVQAGMQPMHRVSGTTLAGLGGLVLIPINVGYLLHGQPTVRKVLYVLGLGFHLVAILYVAATGVMLSTVLKGATGQESINRFQIHHDVFAPIVLVGSLVAVSFELFRSTMSSASPPPIDSVPESNNPYQPPGAG